MLKKIKYAAGIKTNKTKLMKLVQINLNIIAVNLIPLHMHFLKFNDAYFIEIDVAIIYNAKSKRKY